MPSLDLMKPKHQPSGLRRRLSGLIGPVAIAGLLLFGSGLRAQEASMPLTDWLHEVQQAPLRHTYQGTLVIHVGSQVVSARVTHAMKGDLAVERVDVLSGEPRTSFRYGDQVITIWPDSKRWVSEERQDLGVFSGLSSSPLQSMTQYYNLRGVGADRMAGRDARVFEILPTDDLRWGYRIWRDAQTGLVLKMQTLSVDAERVLEQSVFSELNTEINIDADAIVQAMKPPAGFVTDIHEVQTVDPADWGLQLHAQPWGFYPTGAQLRKGQRQPLPQRPLQWAFSDGLASVSVFYEPAEAPFNEPVARAIRQGATHTLVREGGAARLTLVGEVPLRTLQRMADAFNLELQENVPNLKK